MEFNGWKTISSKIVYKNPWISVREDKVLDERENEKLFGVMDLPGGSSILPIDPNGDVYLVKQFRYGLGSYSIETPGGMIDDGETPEQAGKRELFEELGITTQKIISLGTAAGLTSTVKHIEHLYLAQLNNVPEVKLESEEEVIELIKVPFEQAVEWAVDSTITHSLAVITILRAKAYLERV